MARTQTATQIIMGSNRITRPVATVLNWLALRRSYKALAALDDHLLRDVGLTRDAANAIRRPGRPD